MPVNRLRLRRWPNTNSSLGLLYILRVGTWHPPNSVSMLTHSLRRWPAIKQLWVIVLFSDCCVGVTMRVALASRRHNHDNNTISRYIGPILLHNAGPLSATVGQHYSNQNPKSSNHYLFVKVYFF